VVLDDADGEGSRRHVVMVWFSECFPGLRRFWPRFDRFRAEARACACVVCV